jgi:hypothetical protein
MSRARLTWCFATALVLGARSGGAFPLGGTITDGTNAASGVTVLAGTNATVTDANGAYLFTNLVGAFVVTPTQGVSLFNPAHRTLVMQAGLTNVNFERGVTNYTTLITTCDGLSFTSAIAIAGNIGFDCDGTIVFTNAFTVTNRTFSVDAGQRNVTLDGGNTTRILRIWSATGRFANVTFQRGRAPFEVLDGFITPNYSGGALLVYRGMLSVANCTFVSNATTAGSLASTNFAGGGAIHAINADLFVTNSSFVANRAESALSHGGAIYCAVTVGRREVSIDRCLFERNSARCDSTPDPFFYQALGGAVHLEAVGRTVLVHIANTTFVSNFVEDTAGMNQSGNAINNTFGSRLDLTNCTFAYNYSGSNEFQTTLNSSLATTTVRACLFQDTGTNDQPREAAGTIQDLGFNLVQKDAFFGPIFSNPTSRIVSNALLATLGDHGGPTRTIALQVGSPAIDAVTNGPSIGVDQRGALRPYSSFADVGAFESYPTSFVFSAVSPTGSGWRVRGTAQPVTDCRLQASTSLVDWVDVLTTSTAADGTFDLVDAAAYPDRVFYRLVFP